MASELLHEAISLIRAEKMDDARQIIFDIIRNQPQNEVAWIWLAETFSSDYDRLKVLSACAQNIPDSKIVNMAINKLKKKIDGTDELFQSVNPFIEDGTFDPSAPERTGHTGAIIGFDGSFIATDIPDFNEVVDLRAPKSSILHRAGIRITKPISSPDDFSRPSKTAPLDSDGAEEAATPDFEPSIFLEPSPHQTGELNYEPDLSDFLSDTNPWQDKTRKFTEPEKPLPLELPKVMQYNQPPAIEESKPAPAASIFQPIKAIDTSEPPASSIAEAAPAALLTDDLAEDSFLRNSYAEDEPPPRTGVRRNVLLVSGVFAVIILLCLMTTLVLSNYSFGTKTKTATLPVIFIGDIVTNEPKATLPAIVTPTLLPVIAETSTATETFSPTPSKTPLPNQTATGTSTITSTPSSTRMRTKTPTPTPTDRDTAVPTATNSPTKTATITPTPTASNTPLPTSTYAPSSTPTRTLYPTVTNSPIPTATPVPPTSTPIPPTNTPETTAT